MIGLDATPRLNAEDKHQSAVELSRKGSETGKQIGRRKINDCQLWQPGQPVRLKFAKI
jgi:hypothetical protein